MLKCIFLIEKEKRHSVQIKVFFSSKWLIWGKAHTTHAIIKQLQTKVKNGFGLYILKKLSTLVIQIYLQYQNRNIKPYKTESIYAEYFLICTIISIQSIVVKNVLVVIFYLYFHRISYELNSIYVHKDIFNYAHVLSVYLSNNKANQTSTTTFTACHQCTHMFSRYNYELI